MSRERETAQITNLPCPVCGEKYLSYTGLSVDTWKGVDRGFECSACHASGVEHYDVQYRETIIDE